MRIPVISLLTFLAVAAPASASQVLEYQGHGRLVARENPYLPPRQGPEAAGYEPGAASVPQAKIRAARGPSVPAAIAAARRHGDISASTATAYKRSYSRARSARSYLSGHRKKEP